MFVNTIPGLASSVEEGASPNMSKKSNNSSSSTSVTQIKNNVTSSKGKQRGASSSASQTKKKSPPPHSGAQVGNFLREANPDLIFDLDFWALPPPPGSRTTGPLPSSGKGIDLKYEPIIFHGVSS